MENHAVSRRALIAGAPALLAASAAVDAQPARGKLKIAVFSKHLHFLRGEELPRAAAAIGFDAIDITVRRDGHVEPERVAEDLPPLVKAIRAHGLDVPMITTDIVDTESPHAEAIVKTMVSLDIRRYRWGNMKYVPGRPYGAQLDAVRKRVAELAAFNRRYGVCAMYHTHSGVDNVGANMADLYFLLRDSDPNSVSVNYDVSHATIEGGLGGWINGFRLLTPYLRGIGVKDFTWARNARGEWAVQWKPVGDGMVRFPQFFAMVADAGFAGPLQMFFEYPLGGAEDGKHTIAIPREEVYAAMKRDLARVRGYLAQAKL